MYDFKNRFQQFTEKYWLSYLPSSIYGENILVDNSYYLDGLRYMQLITMSEQMNRLISYYFKNIDKVKEHLDMPLSYYYGNEIDYDFLLNNIISNEDICSFNRFDSVFDEWGNIKVVEVNCNLPTTFSEQKYDDLKTNRNSLENRLINYFEEEQINGEIAFLIDESKLDSVASYYIIKELVTKVTNCNINLVGYNNLVVENNKLFAFGKKQDYLLYYLPFETHFKDEKFMEIIEAANMNNLRIINNPKSMLIQNKAFFAILTELYEKGILEEEYNNTICKYIPKTYVISSSNCKQLSKDKDKYIFKPCLGRMSSGVFTGLAFTKEEVNDFLKESISLGEQYIAQELIEILREQTASCTFGITEYNTSYIVFGVFCLNMKYVQAVTRISDVLITNNNSWTLPIKVLDKIPQISEKTKMELKINSKEKCKIIFETEFNGFGLENSEYITNQCLFLPASIIDEMKYIAVKYSELLQKMQNYIIRNSVKYNKIINVDNRFFKRTSDILSVLGRVDIIITDDNKLKVLESNIETPAGVMEYYKLQEYLLSNKDTDDISVNKRTIVEVIKRRLNEISFDFEYIAVLCIDYYEDKYNVLPMIDFISKACSELNMHINVKRVFIKEVNLEQGKLMDKDGNEIKVLYRYFPLDWLKTYKPNDIILNKLNELLISGEIVSLTPNESIICQHKSINAIVYNEINNTNLFTYDERQFIRKYIPYTAVNRDVFLEKRNQNKPFLTKSVLGREGQGIYMNRQYEREVIFQEMENTQSISINQINDNWKEQKYTGFPVYGIYVSDLDECGIYTRVSDMITNKNAYYIPVSSKYKK